MASIRDESQRWSEVRFTSQGVECAARLYRPAIIGRAAPVVVLAHGFGGVRALRLDAYAERFAAAGYVVVGFDYRGFGDSDGQPRQVLDVTMQLDDWRAALAFARTLPGVDPDRVVAWGSSFSGGHVISLAGSGEPLTAIIAQVPHVSGPAAVRATGFRQALRVAGPGVRDQVRAWTGRKPAYIDIVAEPGQRGAMATPDALPGMRRLLHESGLSDDSYPTTVAARIVLKIGLYSPGRRASKVTCPALVQIVRDDAITPEHVAQGAADAMPRATVKTYPGGHFDPYVEPLFSRVVADQIEFLHAFAPISHDLDQSGATS